jgi:hypothetical protein
MCSDPGAASASTASSSTSTAPRSGSWVRAPARALTPARLCFLPKADFRRIVEQNDRIGRIVNANLLRFLVSRLRGKDKELDLIILEDR